MRKIKLTVVAAAFVFAAISAYATTKAKVGLPSCATGTCLQSTQDCCIDAHNNVVKGDFVQN